MIFVFSRITQSLDYDGLSLRAWAGIAYPPDDDWDGSVCNTQAVFVLATFYYAGRPFPPYVNGRRCHEKAP